MLSGQRPYMPVTKIGPSPSAGGVGMVFGSHSIPSPTIRPTRRPSTTRTAPSTAYTALGWTPWGASSSSTRVGIARAGPVDALALGAAVPGGATAGGPPPGGAGSGGGAGATGPRHPIARRHEDRSSEGRSVIIH